jgi:hypothetical protein
VSATFVAFPELDAAARTRLAGIDSLTAVVVAGMAAGDFDAFRREFVRVIPVNIEEEIDFWRQAFQFWTERLGDFTGSKVLGSAIGASDFGPTLDTYALVSFQSGARLISFRQGAQGPVTGFYLEAAPSVGLPAEHRFVPLSEREFAGFSFVFASEVRIEFDIDASRIVRALSVTDGGREVVARKLR